MSNEFRTRYPQGSLIGELLQIDHGKYIVRVSVQIEGLTLATGLAAADTVEAAEDRARLRALALLDLDPEVIPTPVTSPNHHKTTQTKVIKFEDSPPEVVTTSLLSVAPAIETPPEQPEPLLDKEETFVRDFEPEPETESEYFSVVPEDEPVISETPFTLETEEIIPPSPEPFKIPTPSSSDEPTDFSEVIAKSNVEMKRLGWTNEQGRDYLVSTYGKRSRQLLDDNELLEFLHYLESQPTP